MIGKSKILEREKAAARSRFHKANRRIIGETVREICNGQGTILEIGCGHGDISREYIAPNCAFVIATDTTKRFAGDEISNNIKFQLEDALNLSFPDETFDGIISIDVIEHVDDDLKFLTENLRVLKKRGVLFFTTPNRLRLTSLMRYLIGKPIKFPHNYAADPVLGDILHQREYSLNDLRKLLSKFSVSTIEIKGVWFGVPALQIGIVHPLKFLERYCFSWHVKIIKR